MEVFGDILQEKALSRLSSLSDLFPFKCGYGPLSDNADDVIALTDANRFTLPSQLVLWEDNATSEIVLRNGNLKTSHSTKGYSKPRNVTPLINTNSTPAGEKLLYDTKGRAVRSSLKEKIKARWNIYFSSKKQ